MSQKPQIIRERYKIVHEIARGGMGIVYLARDLLTNDQVALKTSTWAAEQKTREAFETEAKLLARLNHPGLPKVRDYFLLDDNYQALVMDFVEGETLSDLLDSGKYRVGPALDAGLVVGWSLQILDILIYLHSFTPPVIHRDIKPNNLKLKPDGTIVLLDFGLAKGSMVSVISGGSSYSSLEQLNMAATDARSDLYALAATLYHLLTNYSPLNAINRFQANFGGQLAPAGTSADNTAISQDPQKSIAAVNPQVPAEISAVVMKAMAVFPEDRFQTAAEMKDSLLAAKKRLLATSIEYEPGLPPPDPAGAKSLLDDDEENLAAWNPPKGTDFHPQHQVLTPLSDPNPAEIGQTRLSFQHNRPEKIGHGNFQHPTGDDFTTFQVPRRADNASPRKIGRKIMPLALGVSLIAVLSLIGLGAWYLFVSKAKEPAASKNGSSPVVPASEAAKKPIEVFTYLVKSDGRETKLEEDHLFEDAEEFRFGLKPENEGYLYVISRNNQDKAQLAYPKPNQVDNSIEKNAETQFPPDNGKFAFNQNSPSEMWAYFVVVASREDELAKRIRTALGNNQEKSLSLPEVDKLMKELDEIAGNSAKNQENKTDSTKKPSVVITKLQKKK